jgi:hypothetical protein
VTTGTLNEGKKDSIEPFEELRHSALSKREKRVRVACCRLLPCRLRAAEEARLISRPETRKNENEHEIDIDRRRTKKRERQERLALA